MHRDKQVQLIQLLLIFTLFQFKPAKFACFSFMTFVNMIKNSVMLANYLKNNLKSLWTTNIEFYNNYS